MTAIFDRPIGGPQTHAFVIGVGRYPLCASAAPGRGQDAHALARRFGDLSSPQASAMRVAEWLMSTQRDDAVAPLGSVELLVSKAQRVETDGVDEPTFAAVRAAFDRWYARCESHADNVAWFFFSGHGCAGDHQLLLTEDVGAAPHRFFANAIDLDLLVMGMAGCRASTQCFFIDACRTTPHEMLSLSTVETDVLIQPRLKAPEREMCTVFATAAQSEALGVVGGTTVFTKALLTALDGAAARQVGIDGPWQIGTGQLAPTIDSLLKWHGETRQQCSPRTSGVGTAIRQLESPPVVPFRLGCHPREALTVAELSLHDPLSGPTQRRGPEPVLWTGTEVAGFWSLQADFPGGEYSKAMRLFDHVPSHSAYDLPVTRKRGDHHADR